MKTQILKVSLIIALGIISISLNAQNTKSLHVRLFNNKLSDQIAIKVNHINNDLAFQMDKMKELIKYKPSSIENETFDANMERTTDYKSALQEIELSVKFSPLIIDNNLVSSPETVEDIKIVTEEMENIVKYRPSIQAVDQDTVDTELEIITNDLAERVKFRPATEILDFIPRVLFIQSTY